MSKYKYIIALDPSGAFWEGKGTTGFSIFYAPDNKFIELGVIRAKDYTCAEAYWCAHIHLLNDFILSKKIKKSELIIVIEDYLLYADKATSQINSHMETPKLIGILQCWCYMNKLSYHMQIAGLVKKRWCDDILEHKGFLTKKGKRYNVCEHTRDSMRHALHFANFKNGDDK